MPMSNTEQVQMIKNWWKEYGYYILFTILFVIIAKFSWYHWQGYKSTRLERASIIYMQALTAFEQKKSEEVKLFGEKLIKDYAKSSYASLAALMLAKNAVEIGDLKSAQEKLQFVVKKAPSKKIRQLARIRVARLLIAMKKPKEAIDLLTSMDDKNYVAEVNEVLGDALLEVGKVSEAKKAYHDARAIDADRELHLPLLKMKMMQF